MQYNGTVLLRDMAVTGMAFVCFSVKFYAYSYLLLVKCCLSRIYKHKIKF